MPYFPREVQAAATDGTGEPAFAPAVNALAVVQVPARSGTNVVAGLELN